jgi:hypothetical protein
LERKRLGSDEAVAAARSVVYDHYNIEHGENWELMESVAGLRARPWALPRVRFGGSPST